MGLKRHDYLVVRPRMRPGDVIAFSGKGWFSSIIRWFTGSSAGTGFFRPATVSHVGIILQSCRRIHIPSSLRPHSIVLNNYDNLIIESTSLDGFHGFHGVTISKMSARLYQYNGSVWWLPLSDASREKLDEEAYVDFLMKQKGKPYDMVQAILSAVDIFGAFTRNRENFSRQYCSELNAAALECAGVVPTLNASEVHPRDLCAWKIYARDYYQLKGEAQTIDGYNSLEVAEQSYAQPWPCE